MSLTFIDTNRLPKQASKGHGEVVEVLNEALCGARNVHGSVRWLKSGETFTPEATDKHQLIYLMEGKGRIALDSCSYDVEQGAGVYLEPAETAAIRAQNGSTLKLFHLIVPRIPKYQQRRSQENVVPVRHTEDRERAAADNEGSRERLLSVLSLFSVERPSWTVEDAAAAVGVSVTTAYRYFRNLNQIGLITPISRGAYMLGPAIIEWDRQIQICDPMLNAARGVMVDLIGYAADGSIVLLCRRFRDRVLCVHQVFGRGPQEPVSYERGRPMPLFRGATSKIILAFFPRRELKSLFAANAKDIARAGLGESFERFAAELRRLRRLGVCIAHGEVDRARVAIAAPIFDKDRNILGSITFVLPEARADDRLIRRLAPLTVAGAREIEVAMNDAATGRQPQASAAAIEKKVEQGRAS